MERNYPNISVTDKAARSLRSGHPWVYADEVLRVDAACTNGQIVDVTTRSGHWLGAGFYNSASKIRVRVLSRNANDRFDEAFWARRVQYAIDYRRTVMGADFDNCRLIFGEADGFPGLTVDRFGPILVAQVLSLGMELRKTQLFALLLQTLRACGEQIEAIYERNDVKLREKEGMQQSTGFVTLEDGVEYHKGTLAGKQVVVCCAGMGKANAAATTQVLITKFGAEKIIFSGIAGNMTSKIGIGDVVIGKTVLYHDAQLDMICQNPPFLKEYTGDPALIAAAEAACAEAGVKALVGKIATGDLFVGDSETKAAIEAKCAPDCVEMEGAAVSQIAAKNGVPCVILRAMSDNADEDGHEVLVVKKFSISEYVATATKIVAAMVEKL